MTSKLRRRRTSGRKPDDAGYMRRFDSFRLSLNQGRVASAVAIETLKGFPKRIPLSQLKALERDGRTFIAAYLRVQETIRRDPSSDFTHSIPLKTRSLRVVQFVVATLNVLGIRQRLGWKGKPPRFDQLVLQQELVMLVAHLEAFLSDTLRVILLVNPDLMKKNLTIEWEQLRSFDDVNDAHAFFVERAVRDFSSKSLAKQLEYLRDLGLGMRIGVGELHDIQGAAEARNSIVHYAGWIPKEQFRKRVPVSRLRGRQGTGPLIQMTRDYVHEISELAESLAYKTFQSVMSKIFHKTEAHGTELLTIAVPKGASRSKDETGSAKIH